MAISGVAEIVSSAAEGNVGQVEGELLAALIQGWALIPRFSPFLRMVVVVFPLLTSNYQ